MNARFGFVFFLKETDHRQQQFKFQSQHSPPHSTFSKKKKPLFSSIQ